ncbi:carbohydrate ABC transporter permease [Allostreptomyces psammosilenae]|uniref:Cellobiose transport system permease protein n=1 Tax=Allostreptomyces psammosilenae TaxID=1892865 RepID=A0A852ZMI2_9ACTN|nr:carbohydrate ABC transporter permease [Allostreptomyces psammosilenae]NYI03609.1 cellobiose transport system permease protein [Allostreptomyces psammosilenae]
MTTDTTAAARPPRGSSPGAAAAPPAGAPARRRRLAPGAGRQMDAGPVAYVLLGITALLSLFPLYWTVVAASQDTGRLADTPPPFLPGPNLWSNLSAAWEQANMATAMFNSFVVAAVISLATVLFGTLAGFAFAKLTFRLRNVLLMVVIGTMMIPPQLSVVPLYMLINQLDWTNQLQAVILPTLVSAVGVFFMRQYIAEALPFELIEAARVDGAHSLRIFWSVVLPIARPAMAVLFMITFVQAWNEFFWPFLVLDQNNPTVQVSLTQLSQGYVPDQSLIMAGALLGTLPLLLLFVVFGRQIVSGIMQGAVKG